MPTNCKSISVESVLKFFEDDIDGMGHDGYPRNQGIPGSIKRFQNWEFCELAKDEFMLLVIPDGTRTLIKDKDMASLGGSSKRIVEKRVKQLQSGENLYPLIVTELLPEEGPPNASFYIKDGAKRAIAYKVYFENNPYIEVKAYIGTRYENVK